MSTSKVIAKVKELLSGAPDGIRYAQLHKAILAARPDIPSNTIHGSLHKFRTELPAEIYQPSKGLYRHVSSRSRRTSLQLNPLFHPSPPSRR